MGKSSPRGTKPPTSNEVLELAKAAKRSASIRSSAEAKIRLREALYTKVPVALWWLSAYLLYVAITINYVQKHSGDGLGDSALMNLLIITASLFGFLIYRWVYRSKK